MGGRQGGDTRLGQNKAQDTEKHPHLNKQDHHTHPRIIRVGTTASVLCITHAFLPPTSGRVAPGGAGQGVVCTARHARMTQGSSCPALRMSSKNANARDLYSKGPLPSSWSKKSHHRLTFIFTINWIVKNTLWLTAVWFLFGENPSDCESCSCTSDLPSHAYSNQISVRTNGQHP